MLVDNVGCLLIGMDMPEPIKRSDPAVNSQPVISVFRIGLAPQNTYGDMPGVDDAAGSGVVISRPGEYSRRAS